MSLSAARVLLAILFSLFGLGCFPTSHQAGVPSGTAEVRDAVLPDAGRMVHTAGGRVAGALRAASDRALASSPSVVMGRWVVSSGLTVAQKARREEIRVAASHAIHSATQLVHTARWAGAIPTAFSKPSGRANARRVKRASRRRIKPGRIAILYAKGGFQDTVQLYDEEGHMRSEAYVRLTKALFAPGDTRLGHEVWYAYHPRVFAMLYVVAQHFQRRIEIVSAFRVPRGDGRRSSNHHRGRAVDFRLKSVPKAVLRRFLDETFSPAGVGWYPNSSFVHLDIRGASYWWTDRSRAGQRQRIRDRKPRNPKRGHDQTHLTLHLSHKQLHSRM
jgi:uncharacterized protein YcbK (DUF882 family)